MFKVVREIILFYVLPGLATVPLILHFGEKFGVLILVPVMVTFFGSAQHLNWRVAATAGAVCAGVAWGTVFIPLAVTGFGAAALAFLALALFLGHRATRTA